MGTARQSDATVRSSGEAPLAFRWQTEVSSPRPFRARAFHGETFVLAATLLQYGAPLSGLQGAGVVLRWQTDGMAEDEWYAKEGGTYNLTTGEVSITWGPECDDGKDRVRFFLALETPGGVSFRAYGTLDLAPSPGFTPAQLVPESALDTLREAVEAEAAARQAADAALTDALAGKADAAGVASALAGKAEVGHTHTLAQVSGLEAALAGKADATGVYTKGEVYAKGETYSRAEVDGKIAGVYHFKGSVQSRAELPTDPSDGDVYNLIGEDGMNVAWNAGAWDELGATVDLSAYSTTAQTTAAIQGSVQTAISQEASARNQAIAQAVAPKADSEDVYAKTETYTKSEVQSLVSQAVEAAKAALLSQLEGLYAPLSSVQHTTDGVTYRWSWDETFQTFAMKAVED